MAKPKKFLSLLSFALSTIILLHLKQPSLRLHFLIAGLPMGYLCYELFSAPKQGAPNRLDSVFGICLSLKFKIFETWVLHVHHWLYLLVLLVVVFMGQSRKLFSEAVIWDMTKGFCIGGTVQGIMKYEDWTDVIYQI